MKSKNYCIVFILLFLQTQLFAQVFQEKYVSVQVAPINVIGDIGSVNGIFNGMSFGVGYIAELNYGFNTGVIFHYSFASDSDIDSEHLVDMGSQYLSSARNGGYTYKSQMLELGFLVEYNLLHLLKGSDNPLKFYIGVSPNYLYSTGNVYMALTNEVVMGDDYDFEHISPIQSFIIYPSLKVSYQVGNLELGTALEVGFSNTDYLDQYTSKFSMSYDHLYRLALFVNLKL